MDLRSIGSNSILSVREPTQQTKTSLHSLPTEIHEQIASSLDSTGLISLHQTCRYFRTLITPERRHFVQRLLALELLPQFGPIPIFRARDSERNIIQPSSNDVEAWESMRYACVKCMKLLPPSRFNNQCILQLRMRKPQRDWEPAKQLTDWTPGDNTNAKSMWLRKQRQLAQRKADERALKLELIEHLEDREYGNPDPIEKRLCGIHRHKRTCNECRFTMGFFKRRSRSNIGDSIVPVITGHQRNIANVIERNFPGLFPLVDPRSKKPLPPTPTRTLRDGRFCLGLAWTLYSARCASCDTWQEAAAFRIGSNRHKWQPIHFSSLVHMEDSHKHNLTCYLRCNHCVAKQDGMHILKGQLIKFWKLFAAAEEVRSVVYLTRPWVIIAQLKDLNRTNWAKIEPILRGLPQRYTESLTNPNDLKMEHLDDLRDRVSKWREFYKSEWDHKGSFPWYYHWLCSWTENYEFYEGYWLWAHKIRETVRNDPDLLLKYALDGSPYAI